MNTTQPPPSMSISGQQVYLVVQNRCALREAVVSVWSLCHFMNLAVPVSKFIQSTQ